ncbi:hypothetical protein PMI40_03384, partial [Herbaspirillum sp. YR522]
MQSKQQQQQQQQQVSPVTHPTAIHRRVARKALVALGTSLCLASGGAWADVAQPLGAVTELSTLAESLPALAPLPSSLVRVVYFRDAHQHGATSPAARVFVDGRFHTALPAGNFAMFCLPAGLHTLASLDRPDALYSSSAGLTPAQLLMGGNTYVVQAGNAPMSQPASMIDGTGPQAARYTMNQSRLLSRARTVACPVQQAS